MTTQVTLPDEQFYNISPIYRWCIANCKSDWWFSDGSPCEITFEDDREATIFILKWSATSHNQGSIGL